MFSYLDKNQSNPLSNLLDPMSYGCSITDIFVFSMTDEAEADKARALPNELSAPYEAPHFPIEKIETKKLM